MSLKKRGRRDRAVKCRMNCGMGKPTGIENFRVFGSECFAHTPAKTRRELDKKGRKGYLLGYLDEGKGVACTCRVVIFSGDVIFKPELVSMKVVKIRLPKDIKRDDMYAQSDDVRRYESAGSEHETREQPHRADENVRQLRDSRAVKRTDSYGRPIMYVAGKIPVVFNETRRSEKKELWKKAMRNDMESHHENKI